MYILQVRINTSDVCQYKKKTINYSCQFFSFIKFKSSQVLRYNAEIMKKNNPHEPLAIPCYVDLFQLVQRERLCV